ncbi:hypothetical protein WHR41_03702 [Cladosporium halotolerans]|uniref:Glucosamine-phosphate N-acetyltransferase n=1 Tax=Cladosporium halotolerans TaxID=1052096 RepID=A0AB34KWJ1_9PEZI
MEDVIRESQPVGAGSDLDAMISTNSDFVDFILPLKERLALYDRTSPPSNQPKNDATDPAKSVPQGFIDAMSVREEVFVKEQGVVLENELDFDDRRCFTWTAYASVPGHMQPVSTNALHPNRRQSTSTKLPIGTIRLVPPPNAALHHFDKHRHLDGTPYEGTVKPSFHNGKEPFIKLGRLAILKEFRGVGVSKLLVDSALTMAHDYPHVISDPPSAATKEELRDAVGDILDMGTEWTGLVLIHAQIGLQKFWSRWGFEVDEGMGIWDEEGIDHVGMWKRMDLKTKSKETAPYSYTEEPKRFRGSVS